MLLFPLDPIAVQPLRFTLHSHELQSCAEDYGFLCVAFIFLSMWDGELSLTNACACYISKLELQNGLKQ